jgi:NADPH:quinone reductase-like Zn-dependent oxidoreductase/acyl carrier protein
MRPELACLRPVLVDLSARLPGTSAEDLLAEMSIESPEPEVAYREATRYVNRIVFPTDETSAEWHPAAGTAVTLRALGRGGKPRRGFVESAHAPLAPEMVRVAVRRCAFTEPDHRALKEAGGSMPALALHCVGRIAALGEGVAGLALNQEVLVLAPQRTMASHVSVPASMLLPLPDLFRGGTEIAALDWLTAYHLVFHLGGLCPGQAVLITRAATGIGAAAAFLVRSAGARAIVADAGAACRSHLMTSGWGLVSDSSSLALCDDVERWTDGAGVDLGINAAEGEQGGLALRTVREGGCFIDVAGGSCGELSMTLARPGVSIRRLDAHRIWSRDPELAREAVRGLQALLAGRPLPEVPAEILPAWRVEEAIELCAGGDRIGKIVVDLEAGAVPVAKRVPGRAAAPDASYLVTGGFGGIGIAVLRWLHGQGARHIVVVSRSGPATDVARGTLTQLEEAGVEVVSTQVDVADGAALARGLGNVLGNMPPLRGVIHAAGVLADASLAGMDAELVHRVMRPKAYGALHLHRLSAAMDLDFFVCFSSIAASFGNAGQLNYAAANGFLHGLVQWRRAAGLPGTCIHLGPVAGVGMAVQDPRVREHLERRGLGLLSTDEIFAVLEEALAENWACFDLARIDLGAWSGHSTLEERLRLSEVYGGEQRAGDAATALSDRLLALHPAERRELIFDLVVDVCVAVLQVSRSRIDATTSLGELGVDSLMAAEIVAEIAERTGVHLRMMFVARGPAIAELTAIIEAALLTGTDAPGAPGVATPPREEL